MGSDENIPQGFKLRHTLRGHKSVIGRIAWSPDGSMLASSSDDSTIRLWDAQTGKTLNVLTGHSSLVYSVAWSPSGSMFASASDDCTVRLWNAQTGKPLCTLAGHTKMVRCVAWSPDGHLIASSSQDRTIRLWDSRTGELFCPLTGPSDTLFSVAWSPDGTQIVSGCADGTVWLWDGKNPIPPLAYYKHTSDVYSVAWSPDGQVIASSSKDRTVCLWSTKGRHPIHIFEGHTSAITSISFSANNLLLASKSHDERVRIWQVGDTWKTIAILEETSSGYRSPGIAFHPSAPVLATLGENDRVIRIWDLDIPTLLGATSTIPSTHYRNAKVVLVGDSGVGKSALSLVLTGQPFAPTTSTHGRYIWNFDHHEYTFSDGRTEQRETMLWDLAGQPAYRLIHQLHLYDVAVALVVFDSHNPTDPFAGISHWVRALRMAQQAQGNSAFPIKKLLVAARVDCGTVKVGHERIAALIKKWGFDNYFETSALEGINISLLREVIKWVIDWNRLPKVTSTDLFQRLKSFLTTRKAEGLLLSQSDALYHEFLSSQNSITKNTNLRAEFETCIGLVEAQGLIRRLSFGGLVLLQPELLDAYASALINAAREEPDELGSIPEKQVQAGEFYIPSEVRIVNKDKEKLLLIAMIEDLLRHEIALREQGYLVFPSEAVHENPNLPDPEGKTIIFAFEGAIQNIYTTLAVRLSHSGQFVKKELWKDAITYKANVGGVCGIHLSSLEDGLGELCLFFDNATSEETRFQFEEYVRLHLERRALPGTIQRRRIFRCPSCKEALTDGQVRCRRERNQTVAYCPGCDTQILLLDGEERLGKQSALMSERVRTEKLIAMDAIVDQYVKREADLSTIQGKIATNDFDVFLCHNTIDKPAIKNIGEQLKQQGILPWLDEWQLQPGLPWQRILEQQITKIKSAAVFIGKDGIGPWEQVELEAFLREFVKRKCPVIPVILTDAPREPQLPIFLQGMTWVDFRKQDPDPMEQLVWGITGRRRQPCQREASSSLLTNF